MPRLMAGISMQLLGADCTGAADDLDLHGTSHLPLLLANQGTAYGRFLLSPTPHTAPDGIHARHTTDVLADLADLAATAIALSRSGSAVEHGDRG